MSIHPAAIVSSQAVVDPTAEIGPLAIVEAHATIGPECRVAAHAVVKEYTVLGRQTVVGEGAVVGGAAQHLRSTNVVGRVVIGERTVLREHVTVHRPLCDDGETRIGDDCFLMVGAHVAHDCTVGNLVMLTNNVMLGGHVEVGERAVLGGGVAVHQFTRVGALAMVGGCARVVQDIPPFVLTDGSTGMIVGLNRIGLRRAGLPREAVQQLKEAYRLIYRSGLAFDEMVAALEERFSAGPASQFAPFFRSSRRGFVQERRSPPRPVIRLHPAAEEESVSGKRLAG